MPYDCLICFSEDYAVPLVGNTLTPGFHGNNIPPTPMRTLPPLQNFFPSPPPVPPPPEKYYAATEICQVTSFQYCVNF